VDVLVTHRFVVLLAALAVAAGLAASAAWAAPPTRIALPDGFQPEGIAISGNRFYVGSIPTGAVYGGSVLTGKGAIVVRPAEGRSAIGLKVDRERIFVAGGQTGRAFVYDEKTGRSLAAYRVAGADSFVNDVVVTRTAAWFTDSFKPVLYRVPLGAGGAPGRTHRVVGLSGAYRHEQGFNLNGIAATANGATLVVVQSGTGMLFTVDAKNGRTRAVDLGGESVPGGDGIVLAGRQLYVVQNRSNVVAKVTLRPDLRSGRVVKRISSRQLDVPTTAALHAGGLYAVNARFGTAASATTEYWVTRLPK
jgi:sugar lactone lactonase YvrE